MPLKDEMDCYTEFLKTAIGSICNATTVIQGRLQQQANITTAQHKSLCKAYLAMYQLADMILLFDTTNTFAKDLRLQMNNAMKNVGMKMEEMEYDNAKHI